MLRLDGRDDHRASRARKAQLFAGCHRAARFRHPEARVDLRRDVERDRFPVGLRRQDRGRQRARVVHDEQVARAQDVREVEKARVRVGTPRSIGNQHAHRVARDPTVFRRRRRLDQLRRTWRYRRSCGHRIGEANAFVRGAHFRDRA